MVYLSVEGLTKATYGDTKRVPYLFKDLTFGIEQGQKVALVGMNGTGKSTLFRILAGYETPDKGEVIYKNDIKVAFAEQNPYFEPGHQVHEAIFDANNPTLQLLREYDYHLKHSETSQESMEKLPDLIQQIDSQQAWDYESQVNQILGELGIYNLEQPVDTLSGGQKKRLALARVLIEKPDLLLLDEPTNHLDLATIEWLEDYLASQQMSLMLVTHDRYFLERVTNQIFELKDSTIYKYKGNYAYYLEKRAELESQKAAEVSKAQNLLKKELAWMKTQPKARGTKAKARVDNVGTLQEKAEQNVEDEKMQLSIKGRRMGSKILEAENITHGYGKGNLIEKFTYKFKQKDRIGMIGPNGSGKSTFLNLITQKIKPSQGEVTVGSTIEFGYYTQEEHPFDPEARVMDVIKEVAEVVHIDDSRSVTAAQLLEHFLFPKKMHYVKVGKLSGGEKRRLQLMRVLMQNPNFLILDEPTNDLDLTTLNILEDFLYRFEGVLILVSHDRYFMDRLVDHIFVFRPDTGYIEDFPGNYTDYRNKKEESTPADKEQTSGQAKKKAKPQDKQEKTDKKDKNKPSYKEKQEYDQLSKEISKLEEEKSKLTEELNQSSDKSYQEIQELSEKIKNVEIDLEQKSSRWFELAEQIES